MLMGIQVKLLMAAHTLPLRAPDSVMPAGDIMNVTQELATNEDGRPEEVAEDPEANMDPLPGTAKPVPSVVPEVHGEGLGKEQERVDPVGRDRRSTSCTPRSAG